MNDLETHIKNQNDKTRAWVAEDPKNRWAALPVEDKEHWVQYGITTPEQWEHHMLVSDAFELTRSAFGYKPSWTYLSMMTNAELEKEIKFLGEECRRQAETEQNEELAHEEAMNAAFQKTPWTIGEVLRLS
jgi:hypothetical protein